MKSDNEMRTKKANATATIVIRQNNCFADVHSPTQACTGYTPIIHWSYLAIILGAGCFLATALLDRTGRAPKRA